MRTLLLAVTAALAVVAGINFFSEEVAAPTRLLAKVDPIESAWSLWKSKYNKGYGAVADETYRRSVFAANYRLVQESNANPKNTFKLALNKFADLDGQEWKAQYTGLKTSSHKVAQKTAKINYNVPASVDWRNQGVVNAVKDQGQCGSCWAFSVVTATESAQAIQQGASALASYSEQQLVDCAGGQYMNQGCNGGNQTWAFSYMQDNGDMLESAYPYTAQDGYCQYDSSQVRVRIGGYETVTANSASALRSATAQQVVSVSVEADRMAWQLYDSGVLNSESCGTQLDHAVAVVGYDTDATGQKYWIVRNSWGASWGEQGYIRLADNGDGAGICGVLQDNSYPTM